MSRTQKRALCWLYALLMTAALFVWAFLFADVRFDMNDDVGLLRAFLGYENGTPARFHIYIHGLLAMPLGWLSTVFPALPWYSYMLVGMMALSCLLIAKSIMQVFVRRQKPLWLGAVFAALFLLLFCLKYVVYFTFTQVAAMLGAAAVLQLFSIDHDRGSGRVIWGMMGALVPTAFAYALRQAALLPVLAFCGLAFVFIIAEHYWKQRSVLPMVLSLVLIVGALGGLMLWREAEIRQSGQQEYLTWQESNTAIIDYYGLANVPQEALDMVGWDDTTRKLGLGWCFLEKEMNAENFEMLTRYMQEHDTRTLPQRLSEAWETFATLLVANRADMLRLALTLLVALIAIIGAFAAHKPRYVLAVLLVLLGAAATLAALAIRGRMPMRAALMALLPMAATLFAILPAALSSAKPAAVAALLCAAYSAWCLTWTIPTLLPNEAFDLAVSSCIGDLEEFALEEPDSLFLCDVTVIVGDMRAFPDYREGMPHNITFWGGWCMRSKENRELFERFDIDLDDFDPATFLRDDVYLASGRVDPPPTLILEWLREEVSETIDWEIYSEYGNVYIFHFYDYEE